MKVVSRLLVILAGIFALSAFVAPSAFAQNLNTTASSEWKSSWGPNSADQQSVDYSIALGQYAAAHGAYGANTTYSTTNVGTLNSSSIYNGTVQNSGATNSINSNESSATISGNSSAVTLTLETSQGSTTASQNAKSAALSQGAASSATISSPY